MKLDAVISDLYAAANGRVDWPMALGKVAELLNLWTVQVLGADKRSGQLIFSTYGGSATPQTSLDYFRYYGTIDPRIGPALAAPDDQWTHCHKLFDDGYVARSPFYQEFLIPHGGRYVSATTLINNNEVQFLLALMRGHGNPPLGSADMSLLAQLKHHFTEALRNLVHLRETYTELGMARELLNQFSFPMFLVDDTRGIWHRNEAAQLLLDQRNLVREENGFLTGLNNESNGALTDAIDSLNLMAPAQAGALKKRALPLRTKNGDPYLAFVSAMRPDMAMGAFGRAPRALIIFHDPQKAEAGLNAFIVGECFNLTPAEARVAVQIAAGASAKQMAQDNGTALPTVRTQIKRVMEKTGVNRQADLIRLLLQLPMNRGD